MELIKKLSNVNSVFIDTAPFIYYIEGHLEFGERVKEVMLNFQSGKFEIYSSVITLTEVLPKPILIGNKKLVNDFLRFLKNRRNFYILEITREIAIEAGKLRGKYNFLKSIDAIQFSTAIDADVDIFLTNDKKLKQVKELDVWTMEDLKLP